MEVGGQHHTPAALPPGKTWYPLYRRLGGTQGRSGWVQKISPPPGFDPRTVQPVASHYTDWAILALNITIPLYICHSIFYFNKWKLFPAFCIIIYWVSKKCTVLHITFYALYHQHFDYAIYFEVQTFFFFSKLHLIQYSSLQQTVLFVLYAQ